LSLRSTLYALRFTLYALRFFSPSLSLFVTLCTKYLRYGSFSNDIRWIMGGWFFYNTETSTMFFVSCIAQSLSLSIIPSLSQEYKFSTNFRKPLIVLVKLSELLFSGLSKGASFSAISILGKYFFPFNSGIIFNKC
jgi:hypothetical protein